MQDDNVKIELIDKEQALEAKKAAIAEQAMGMGLDLAPESTEIAVDLDKATRLPFGELAALGTAFASLPEAFQTASQAAQPAGEVLYRVTNAAGVPIDVTTLFKFGDGNGLLGSFSDAAGLHQAHLHPVASQAGEAIASVPYDATSLFIAATLMEVNKKLDAIQETQKEMFAYLKNKDKATQRANLQQLADILEDYRYHWGNKDYMDDKRNLVQIIKKEAETAINQHRAEIGGKLQKAGIVLVDKNVRDKAHAVREELGEYRLAVYLYGFSSFLEVMLRGNFDANYLEKVASRIEERSLAYRMLYTQAYDLIAADADSSVRARALGGISGAMGFLSKAIEKTPVGAHTLIDEALGDASKGIGEFSKGLERDMMGKLVDAKSSDVRPFIDNIENVSRLYNEPVMLMADEVSVYVLPASATSLDTQAA